MSRRDDQLAAHIRRLGNHALNELLLQLPKPRFAALIEAALARPVLPAGLVLRFEPTPALDRWTVVACAPRRQLGTVTRHQDPIGRIAWGPGPGPATRSRLPPSAAGGVGWMPAPRWPGSRR